MDDFKSNKTTDSADQYYRISKPREENKDTGNFTVQNWMLNARNKDFLFEGVDPETGKYMRKVLDRDYVKKHTKPFFNWVESVDLSNGVGKQSKKKVLAPFSLISFEDIKNYVKPAKPANPLF